MIIPSGYTPIQIVIPDDKKCYTIQYIWRDIYNYNYPYVSHVDLARKYNLIYALIDIKCLHFNYSYTTIPLSSAKNIEFYKLNKSLEMIVKEENNILKTIVYNGSQEWYQHGIRYNNS